MVSPSTHRYRRRNYPRRSMATTALLLAAGGGLGLGLGSVSAASTKLTEPSLVPLDTAMLTTNMRHWTTDYAVMFYAPWCQHCREAFLPLWEEVSMRLAEEDPKGKRKLVMGKFDCEQDFAAKNFCENQIQMQFYPTFMFFGAGKFHDHDPLSGVVLGPRPTVHDSTALFPMGAMVYHEVMAHWVKTMNLVSGSNRFMEKWNPFSGWGKSKTSSEERLVEEMEALERQNHQLQQAMAGGGSGGQEAAEGGVDGLPYGYGDVYTELSQVSWDPEFEVVMACVIDLSMQYCDYDGYKDDPWCSTLESCVATEFRGNECWPSSCPFEESGCEVTSNCLRPDILDEYMKLYSSDERDAATAAAAEAGEEGDFWTWPEGSDGAEAAEAAEAVALAAEQAGADAEQAGAAPGLPPFLGRRPAAGAGGVDRAGDERRETVAA